ncbi:MAG: bifunctional hydroxymethylpyrimidine kinase/phosphomethylpyrimidine kinase [Pseudomonadota bacterium]
MTPRILSIAGSDSGGGAGIQADIKTATAFEVYSATAITALTAQNTLGVTDIHPVPPRHVAAQIEAVLSDIGADAIKIGMLANADIADVVARCLEAFTGPIILDPVMVATSGDRLLAEDAIEVIRSTLCPMAAVITPNLPEMDVLSAKPGQDLLVAAMALSNQSGAAVLLKGGHGDGEELEDTLITDQGTKTFTAKRLISNQTHGTGCTLSTAIACGLAHEKSLEIAVEDGLKFVRRGIETAPGLGDGHGPLNFFK